MPELLSPGVFVEEVPSNVNIVGAVSTSNAGMASYSYRGVTDEATLVGSFAQFQRDFGSFVAESLGPLSAAAFYKNGGRRLFFVRCVPSDAVAADCRVQSSERGSIGTGDGVTVAWTSAGGSPNLTALMAAATYPVKANSVALRWRGEAAAPVAATAARQRSAPGTALAAVATVNDYEGRVNPTLVSMSSFFSSVGTGAVPLYPELYVLAKATFTVGWTTGAAPASVAVTLTDAATATGTNGSGSSVTVDRRTGMFVLNIDPSETPDDATSITTAFTAATEFTAADDGAGALVSSGFDANGTINYTTGAVTFTTTGAGAGRPTDGSPILATYTSWLWDLDPISKGAWGDDIRITIAGNADYFTAATASYSRYNVNVLLRSDTGAYELRETYDELNFTDTTSTVFFPDALNDLSDLMTVAEPGANKAPAQLNGRQVRYNVAAGLGTAPAITARLASTLVAKRSVSITYTEATTLTTRTITDDGNGNLTGDVNGAGTNSIDYTTGAILFTPVSSIEKGTFVTATYYTQPAATSYSEDFGVTAQGFTAGSNGTFTSSTYGRDQLTNPALEGTSRGIYALNRVEELMQVILPDYAGDLTVTGDLLDYAASRTSLPHGGDRFVILTVPRGSSAQDAVDWLRFQLARNSDYAAVYWPWVKVADPLANGRPLVMPPLGHIAGVYARTDATRNVAKAPAGVVDGALQFLLDLESRPTQAERDYVYPNKINPLISSAQTGMAVWGSRTISATSQWRQISTRRLFMFLERSIYNSTFWIVFEPNGPALWARVRAQVGGFMMQLFQEGYFKGQTPKEAFVVTVDETINTDTSRELGQVLGDIGAAAEKPSEFVRFRFSQISSV